MKWKMFILIMLCTAFLLYPAVAASADGPPPDHLELEPSYYEGGVYVLAIPSAKSANPNQAVFACFNLGPNLIDQQTGTYGTLYVVLAPGATQVACPDGSLRHDHVLSAVPGVDGYVPFWQIILVTPGPGFDISIMPVTSVADVEAAVLAGQLELLNTGIIFNAPVIGQSGN